MRQPTPGTGSARYRRRWVIRRICYLHIGLHKSASTTLQRLVIGNVEELGRAGVFVPETGTRGYKIPHHELASEHHGRAQGTACFSMLRKELISRGYPERIIISSEEFEFSISQATKQQSLVTFFSDLGYKLKFIAYLRPQDGYINSSYSQMTKFLIDQGTFEEHLEKALERVRFDYSRHLLPLFREPAITVALRPFNRATLLAPIEADFLAALDLSADEAARVKRVPPFNETPGPKTIALCRAVVAQLAQKGLQLSKRQRNRAGRFIRELTTGLGWNDTKFNALTPEISAAIHRHFANSNRKFAREVWDSEWDEVFRYELAREVVQNVYDPASDLEGLRQFEKIKEKALHRIVNEIAPTVPRRFWFQTGRHRRAEKASA